MIIRKIRHITKQKKEKITAHLEREGFILNKDFYFEQLDKKIRIQSLVLLSTDNVGSIFDSYSKIEETMFRIRMAKDREQESYDMVTFYYGTIEGCKQYLKDNFELDSYEIIHCMHDCNKFLDISDLK